MADNPLSPHIQVYRPQLTSVLSITHRISGIFLSIGTVMLLYWLMAAAMGLETYQQMQRCFASWPAQLLLLGWTAAFYYHLLNGVRHLLMDAGWGLELDSAYKTGYAAVAGTLILTTLSWACVLAQGGAA